MSSNIGPRARNTSSLHPSVFDTLDNSEWHLKIDCNFSRFFSKIESLIDYALLEVIGVMSAEGYFAFFAWHGGGSLQQRNKTRVRINSWLLLAIFTSYQKDLHRMIYIVQFRFSRGIY